MYGAILGDIVGSVYEWHSTKKKDFPLFSKHSHFTDDSVMSIAVAEVCLSFAGSAVRYTPLAAEHSSTTEGLPADDEVRGLFADSMRKWGKKYPHAGYGGTFSSWLTTPGAGPYNSWGNGSAMRVSAVGWLFDSLEKTRHIARLSADVTHNHPEGIKGAEAAASAIYILRTGGTKADVKDYIAREFDYDLDRTVDGIRPDYSFDVSCQGTVPEAVICFLEGSSTEDTIRNAVSLGGDADTLGCIAGSIAEAMWGVSEELKNEVQKRVDGEMRQILCKVH